MHLVPRADEIINHLHRHMRLERVRSVAASATPSVAQEHESRGCRTASNGSEGAVASLMREIETAPTELHAEGPARALIPHIQRVDEALAVSMREAADNLSGHDNPDVQPVDSISTMLHDLQSKRAMLHVLQLQQAIDDHTAAGRAIELDPRVTEALDELAQSEFEF